MAFRDPKFESFLKKTLPPKEYEQVKITEACVVVSSTEKHSHRFVFVTDKKVGVTTNPPKALLWTIHFSEILDIDRIYDSANFLQKSLKDSVQHILVKIKVQQPDQSNSSKAVKNIEGTSSGRLAIDSSDIHMYILNFESHIHQLMCSLWTSHLLEYDEDDADDDESIVNDVNRISVVYQRLYRNILSMLTRSHILPEQVYRLFHELKVMLKSSMFAKSLFWRSSDMLVLCNNYLTLYLSSEHEIESIRADEIECASLVLETICVAMEKTETLSSCQKVVQQCSKNFLTSLVGNLLATPQLAASMSRNRMIDELCAEYTRSSAYVFYELLLLVERGLWTHNRHEINRASFSQLILSYAQHLDYIDSLAQQFVVVWKTNGVQRQLTAKETSNIYRICFVINHFISMSSAIRKHLSLTFLEEYTYLVKPFIRSKLSTHQPASLITHTLLQRFQVALQNANQPQR